MPRSTINCYNVALVAGRRASAGIVYKLKPDLQHEFTPFFAHYKPYFRGKADTVWLQKRPHFMCAPRGSYRPL